MCEYYPEAPKIFNPYQLVLDMPGLEPEIWVACRIKDKQFPDYKVSNLGRVLRVTPGDGTFANRILTLNINSSGYPRVSLFSKGGASPVCVHRLVMLSFHDGDSDALEVNHIDSNRANNHLSNLEWVTPSQNMKHSWRDGRRRPTGVAIQRPKGTLNPRAKLNESQVREILRRLSNEESPTLIAKDYPVTRELLYRIKKGRAWTHISGYAPARLETI